MDQMFFPQSNFYGLEIMWGQSELERYYSNLKGRLYK